MNIGTPYRRYEFSGQYDSIVIGSGIGGLTCAAMLAKHARERVLVLERHYTAGGFTHAFRRPGFDWDVGVHYIGDVSEPGLPTRRMFDHLTEGRLTWADMGEAYDVIEIAGRRYEFLKGKEAFRARMKSYFPKEARAIDAYLKEVERAVAWSQAFFAEKVVPELVRKLLGGALRYPGLRYARRTTAEVVDRLTNDAELKAVLTGQWGDYGLPPGESSFLMHALVANHYLNGAAYPVGGAPRIAASILPTIEGAGGAVVVRAEVSEILVENGRAVGVRMADGREVRARKVISNAGVGVTYGRLLPEAVRQQRGLSVNRPSIKPSCAHLSLYIGLDCTAEALGLSKANRWIYPSGDHDGNVARFLRDASAPFPVVYLSFPSAKDPDFTRRHPGRGTMEAIVPAAYDAFEKWQDTKWGDRGDDYKALKQALTDRLLETIFAQLPAVKGHVTHTELSTPLSTRHFAGHPRGEIYGLAHTPQRFEDRSLAPRTPVPGLYLTGVDVCTAGVAGGMLGGLLTVSAILGRNMLSVALKRPQVAATAPEVVPAGG